MPGNTVASTVAVKLIELPGVGKSACTSKVATAVMDRCADKILDGGYPGKAVVAMDRTNAFLKRPENSDKCVEIENLVNDIKTAGNSKLSSVYAAALGKVFNDIEEQVANGELVSASVFRLLQVA